ncbi:MAG TPA: SMP-30/gluconolactonase/LRE family protein [Ktedonobacteraceae bacterium]|nr:SMP-30/gluconolactonase/LRE family protein [Ktedonobacteraceae bacterium]
MKEAQHFLSIQNRLGEGSFWDDIEQRLYWLDIKERCFYRMDVATRQYERFDVGVQIGVMALRAGGGFVMATDHGFVFWNTSTKAIHVVANPIAGQANKRFNDGNIDTQGRFWAGTMCDPVESCTGLENHLYRLDPDGSLHMMDGGLGMPNGLVWSPDNHTMYLTDSPQQVIYAYDFDEEAGTIKNRRPFIQTSGEPGVPDGLTIDNEGYLWSVRYNGRKILRYDPDGSLERTILVPAEHPTSCTFGGPNMSELYITTAWNELSEEQRQQAPQNGDLFSLHTTIQGPGRRRFAG